MSSKVYVLYVDHQGHPAPLSSCYHATGSRRLSSSVDRSKPSTLSEVDSAYCPQTLAPFDAESARRLKFSPKAASQRCPVCQSALTVGADDLLCFYACGFCGWDSRGCNLTQRVNPQDDGSLSRVEITRALEDLGGMLESMREASKADMQKYSKDISAAWAKRTKDGVATEPRRTGGSDGPEGWSVEALEASLNEKKTQFLSDGGAAALVGMEVERISLESEPEETDESIQGVTQLAVELQLLNSPFEQSLVQSRNDMLPLPMPLHARLSRRCRAELEEGRPGILLKPKLNPVEGDSSLRSGHGHWWKKDSSAIHVMPRIGVLKHEVKGSFRVLLLKVTNPTLGPVRLRFASSSYQGEPGWNEEERHPVMPDLLVDELFQVYLNLELKADIIKNMKRTGSVELLSAEDSFIELGGKSREIPDEVKNWEPKDPQSDDDDNNEGQVSMMRLVASSASTAYFELALANAAGPGTKEGHAVAVPLVLELEAGNGSWESSLIPKSTKDENEADWVPFDLVITWT